MNPRRFLLGCALGVSFTVAAVAAPITVKILGFNDFHGSLQSPGSFSGNPSGGVDYLAAYVARLKAANPNNVVVSAGDLVGASPLISAFFHDEGTIQTMNQLGLEFNAVGNHEFDAGKVELLRKQNGGCIDRDPASCVVPPTPFPGARFRFLAANVLDAGTGKTLLPGYVIKQFAGGVRVAFIGMTLKDTPSIVTPTGVAGLTFADEADTVNALVPKLKARGVRAIVVLIHQGGFQAATSPNFINDCSGLLQDAIASPIKAVVARLDDAVDLVISGHTHTGYVCRLSNKTGRTIPVTQASAFGRVLTDIDMTIDNETGEVTAVSAENVIVDRNDPTVVSFVDPAIQATVASYNALVAPLQNQVIGTLVAPASNTANAAGEMAAGVLIADAQLASTQPENLGGAQFAFMNPGGVRNPGFNSGPYPHDVTYGEAFTVQPFANTLVSMTLTAQQVKDVLEQQFPGCNGQTAQRILQISNGLAYSWSETAAPCSKIVDVTFTPTNVTVIPPAPTAAAEQIVIGGVVQNPAKTYRVTVNNFLSTGGDNFSVLKSGIDPLGGAQDIDALVKYLKEGYRTPLAPYDPANPNLHRPRITRLP